MGTAGACAPEDRVHPEGTWGHCDSQGPGVRMLSGAPPGTSAVTHALLPTPRGHSWSAPGALSRPWEGMPADSL